MFYYVSGPVAHMEANLAVIDCGGVGYACRTTSHTLSKLKQGESAKLFTHLNTREDAMELFGFGTQEELNLFRQLISVSGVGPKAALSILSATTPANLALSIITGDEKALTCAPGIGKKIAQRVILELKDKLMKETHMDDSDLSAAITDHTAEAAGAPARGKLSEAQDALLVLGYTRAEAQSALRSIDIAALSLEDIIKEALKKLKKP